MRISILCARADNVLITLHARYNALQGLPETPVSLTLPSMAMTELDQALYLQSRISDIREMRRRIANLEESGEVSHSVPPTLEQLEKELLSYEGESA